MSDCSHEEFIAEKHVYCPGCGETGNEMVLQKRIKELEQRLTVEEAHSEKYMAENQRLRGALQDMTDGDEWWDIHESKGLPEARCKQILALLGGGE